MMVTTWTAIRQFPNGPLDAPEQLQRPLYAQKITFAFQVTIQNSTRTCRVDRQAIIHCTVQNTMQSYCYEKQGDNTLFINSDQLLFTQQFPSRIIEVTVAFGWKDIYPEVKAFHLPWFKQSPEWIQGSLHLYKASLASVFSRLIKAAKTPLVLPSVSYICNLNGFLLLSSPSLHLY